MWSWAAFIDFLTSSQMLKAAWLTIWLTIVSMGIGLAIALVLALLRLAPVGVLRTIAGAYIWLFRGTPLLVQLIIVYTALPQLGLRFSVIACAIIGLSLNEAAYLAEVVRSGIMSVPKGQFEAARALGMSPYKVMRVVVLPQAARIMVPPLGNSFNGLLKTTTLASVISVQELLRTTQLAFQVNFRVLEGLAAAALYYLVMTTLWQMVQSRIETRLNRAHVQIQAKPGKNGRVATAGVATGDLGGEFR